VIVLKATGADTAGTFFLSETTLAPGSVSPPPHHHEKLHDMFFVLDGTLTVRLGDETVSASPGTFVCVPPGVIHTFSNESSGPARFLNFNTPSGWEHYMRDLAEAARSEPLTPAVIGRIGVRYDLHVDGHPMPPA
jgi:mannose-6-phosphate isomerase-like protein (cupin superfamily)